MKEILLRWDATFLCPANLSEADGGRVGVTLKYAMKGLPSRNRSLL